ncbi:MAG: dual specificity protein phosphatase family protein [Thermomicrobiales bacterium]|nr:dual specificity protein phosphatase family protein [Thermomicrobiales bacterium]
MQRFYWVKSGLLAGCSKPGATGDLVADLDYLRTQGISALLSLTETQLDALLLDTVHMTWLHLPIADMTAPEPWHFREALAFIDAQLARDRAVAVHCLAGQGRTGTILAAWLIHRGHTHVDALTRVRAVCPEAVETAAQEAALEHFAISKSRLI